MARGVVYWHHVSRGANERMAFRVGRTDILQGGEGRFLVLAGPIKQRNRLTPLLGLTPQKLKNQLIRYIFNKYFYNPTKEMASKF
jgi:hypothetical protein